MSFESGVLISTAGSRREKERKSFFSERSLRIRPGLRRRSRFLTMGAIVLRRSVTDGLNT